MVGILAGFAEVLEAGMLGGVFDHLRTQLFSDEAGQAFGQFHPDAADALWPQADGGRQHERRPIRFEEVDGADVGLKRALDELHDVGERLRRVAAVRHEAGDFFERPEQRVFVGRADRRGTWNGHG